MSRKILNQLCATDAVLAGLIKVVGPYRIERDLDCAPFQALAKAITHQQLNGKAAQSILTRFITVIGGDNGFPSPEIVVAAPIEALRAVGLSFAKIASLKDLAAKTLDGIVPDRQTLTALSNDEVIERLTQVRGIGRWTVEMMLMFNFAREDILPVDDFGVRLGFQLAYGLRKMPRERVLALYGERWSPNRSAAAWYLWRACELKRAGKLPEPTERIKLPRIVRKARSKRARK
jgi:DNA-3-methyladenine glycosylase II